MTINCTKNAYIFNDFPENDWNNAFSHKSSLDQQSAITATYTDLGYHVQGGAGFLQAYIYLMEVNRRKEKIDLLIIRHHGTPLGAGGLCTDGRNIVLLTDELNESQKSHFIELLKTTMSNNSSIILDSCSTGNKSVTNIAQILSQKVSTTVFAPQTLSAGGITPIFDTQNQNLILVNVVEYGNNNQPTFFTKYVHGQELTNQKTAKLSFLERVNHEVNCAKLLLKNLSKPKPTLPQYQEKSQEARIAQAEYTQPLTHQIEKEATNVLNYKETGRHTPQGNKYLSTREQHGTDNISGVFHRDIVGLSPIWYSKPGEKAQLIQINSDETAINFLMKIKEDGEGDFSLTKNIQRSLCQDFNSYFHNFFQNHVWDHLGDNFFVTPAGDTDKLILAEADNSKVFHHQKTLQYEIVNCNGEPCGIIHVKVEFDHLKDPETNSWVIGNVKITQNDLKITGSI